MSAHIYLDNNATTKIDPRVVASMVDCLEAGYVNAASQHQPGRTARRILESARQEIGDVLGARMDAPLADQVIITSGGTEANNLAIRGLPQRVGHVLVSSIEHPSALAASQRLAEQGCLVEQLRVERSGHISVTELRRKLRPDTQLVCVMLGNNETGALQPVAELATLCARSNIPFHTDAVQVAGKQPVDFAALGVTSLAVSAHKFHGPTGVGVLLLKHNQPLRALIVGGQQQLGMRPGTESIAAVVGMAKALDLYRHERSQRTRRMRELRDRLEQRLLADAQPVVINGTEPRLPHVTNLSFLGLDRQAVVMALDMAGVACSTGSACTSGSSEPSHVLSAMGCEPDVVRGSIRLSVSGLSTEPEIDLAVDRILSVINNLRQHE